MADASTERGDEVWNPIAGCSAVSPGCTNCYAPQMAERLEHAGGRVGARYEGLTRANELGQVWTGAVRLDEDALLLPFLWRKPARIFVSDMSDLFHEAVPDEWLDWVFAVMALMPQHLFLVLTKRAERMRDYVLADRMGYIEARAKRTLRERSRKPREPVLVGATLAHTWPWPHVWLGVSVEDQELAAERIPLLIETPAAVRWISAEPLLGPIDVTRWLNDPPWPSPGGGISWVVTGAESGPHARPMLASWESSLRDQCAAAGIPLFSKREDE